MKALLWIAMAVWGCLFVALGWNFRIDIFSPEKANMKFPEAIIIAVGWFSAGFVWGYIHRSSAMNKVHTLGDALPEEIARVRDEVLPLFLELEDETDKVILARIRELLDNASKAMISGDVVAMIDAYLALKKL